MKFRTPFGAGLALLGSFLLCARADPTQEKRFYEANADFALRLVRQVINDNPGTNILISPYAVSALLQLLANGTAGARRDEMMQAVGLKDVSAEAVGDYAAWLKAVMHDNGPSVQLTIGSAIWTTREIDVSADLRQAAEERFGTLLKEIDFRSAASREIVNSWAAHLTDGAVAGILEPKAVGTPQLLITSVAFCQAAWDGGLEVHRAHTFPSQSGAGPVRPFFRARGNFAVWRTNGCDIVKLPLDWLDLDLNAYLLLPGTNSTLNSCLAAFDGAAWLESFMDSRHEPKGRRTEVLLSGFSKSLSYSYDFRETLKKMGVRLGIAARLPLQGRDTAMVFLKQKSLVQIDEEGTSDERAGASSPEAREDGASLVIIGFDRPFLFFQSEMRHTIFFVGAVYPSALAVGQ